MKRIILILTTLLVCVCAYSQTSSGSWNSRTATYSNSAHKITWKLIEEWTWVGRPIFTEGTLLKVRNDDTHILVSLGVNKEDAVWITGPDGWITMSSVSVRTEMFRKSSAGV